MRNSEDGLNGRERLAEETGTGPESSMSADAASLVDRRTSIRLLHVIEVTHTSDHNFFIGFTEDISEGGLFVATYAAIEIGELLELSFAVPGLEQVQKVQCRVRWAREDNPSNPDLIPGVGVSFLDLSAEAMTAIQEFIRHRGAIFYPD